MSAKIILLSLVALCTSCAEEIDPSQLQVSIVGYQQWDKVEPLLGEVPGHGDTYRVMYRNPLARQYTGAGQYPLGSAIVKEMYERKGNTGKGALVYKVVMRRMDPEKNPELPITGGWLFTQIDEGEDEFQRDLCWQGCHRQAPFVGAFFDHGY